MITYFEIPAHSMKKLILLSAIAMAIPFGISATEIGNASEAKKKLRKPTLSVSNSPT